MKKKVSASVEYLVETPLYRFYGVKIDWEELGRNSDEAGPFDDEDIEPGEEPQDLSDPVQPAYALNSASETMV